MTAADPNAAPGSMPDAEANQWFAVFAEPTPTDLVRFFDLEGYQWKSVTDSSGEMSEASGDTGETNADWAAAFVVIPNDSSPETQTSVQSAWRFCANVRSETTPVMVLLSGSQMAALSGRHDLYDDFIITPFHPEELRARVGHLLAGTGRVVSNTDLVTYGPLSLNVETYQAVVDGRALDLTFMEYELLRFLASSPGQVFTRETLLNRVWGYEYYGGARTVDVHVRRLRAKMGEEHSSLIATVRGVGYKLGQSRWQG